MKPAAFDLRQYAETVTSETPSYEDLMREVAPQFRQFLSGLRDRLRQYKEAGKKVIVVLGTGGTFQSDETDEGEGMAPTASLEQSFKALGLPEDPAVHLELCDLMKIDSSQLTVDQWRFLAEMIIELEQTTSDMYDVIIATHGTDTMAKGGAYLSFMLRGFPKSIILTGSQEPALLSGTDAKDQMDRSITTAKLACDVNRRIAEVMVCCGLRVSRGTWAEKLGDKTVNAFGPWNQPTQDFDATDWAEAARNGTLHRLAPALLDFGTGKSRGSMEFADHTIDYAHKGPYQPFTQLTKPADLFPAKLTDKSPVALATHIIHQNVALLTQLGSATADDTLVEVALEAARRGKLILFEAPFADSTVQPGKYKAGAKVREPLDRIQRPLPILNTSPPAFEAKINYVLHRLGLAPEKTTKGLGATYSAADMRQFFDHMEQNMVRELV